MKTIARRFCRNENGASLIEYALLCGLVALAAVVGMNALGSGINTAFNNLSTSVTSNTR